MTHSEILKAAHRQAKRLAVGISYRQALSIAMDDMYAFVRTRKPARAADLHGALRYVLPQWA